MCAQHAMHRVIWPHLLYYIPVSGEHILVYLNEYSSIPKKTKWIQNPLDECWATVPSDLGSFIFCENSAPFGHFQTKPVLKKEQKQDASLPKLQFNGEKHFFSNFFGTVVCGLTRRIYLLLRYVWDPHGSVWNAKFVHLFGHCRDHAWSCMKNNAD